MYHARDHCSCNLSKLEVAICGLKRFRLQVKHTIKRPGKTMNTSHFAFSQREGSPAFKAFPAVCTKKSTPSQIDSEKECLEGFLPMIFPGSIQLCAGRDMVVNHQKMKFFVFAVLLVVDCGKQHATGIAAHHLPRREIGDGDQCLSDQFFRLIVSMDTGKNNPVCACSIIQSELKELLGLLYCLASLYLHRPEIGFAEGVEIDLLLKERLNLHV